MEFTKLVEKRQSIRAYRPDPVPAEDLEKIARAVELAPTACNRQPFKLFVITNPALRSKICKITRWTWLEQAPAIAVMAGNYEECWKRLEGDPAADIDCSIAMEHFVLAAADSGLGTCWVCAFERSSVDQALNLKAPWRTFAISPLGYPAETPAMRPRKARTQIFEVIS